MYVLLIIIHLITAFVMVGAILLQSGKGAEIGATFGGSSQTIFGGRGAATFLSKFTWGCAVIFMMTSLGLAILSKERSLGTSLKLPAPPPVSIPVPSSTAPAAPGAPAQSGAQGPAPATAPTAAASTAATPPAQTPASSSAAAPAAGGAPAVPAPATPAPSAAPAKP